MNKILLTLSPLTLVLSSCSLINKTDQPKGVRGRGTWATPEYLQREQELTKTSELQVSSDVLTIKSRLLIPEVEIPERDAFRKQRNMTPASEDPSKVTAGNEHVCFRIQVYSRERKIYEDIPWSADVHINGKPAKAKIEVHAVTGPPSQNTEKFRSSGITLIDVCTDSKFPNGVDKVQLILKVDNKEAGVFNWAKPWPPTLSGINI